MRKLGLFLFLILAACHGNSNKPENIITEPSEKARVTIYYFHLTNRCATCKSIEANVVTALDRYFKKEKESGEVRLRIINVEEKENQDVVKKFQVYGSSLHLVKTDVNQESDNDLTNLAFSYSLRQPELFISIIRENITALLK